MNLWESKTVPLAKLFLLSVMPQLDAIVLAISYFGILFRFVISRFNGICIQCYANDSALIAIFISLTMLPGFTLL